MDECKPLHAGLAKMLLKRGACGTKTTTVAGFTIQAGSTALGIARSLNNRATGFAETLAVLRQMCCGMCGVTSAGMSAMTPGQERHLKQCGGNCPARYCGKECQRADWVARHRGEHRGVAGCQN